MKRSCPSMPALLYPLLVAAGVAVCGELSAREAGAVPATVRYTAGGAVATVRFEPPAIRRTADGLLELSLTNTLTVEQGGVPALPEAVVSVALPVGAQVAGCMVAPSDTEWLALDGVVRHGPFPVSYSTEPGPPAEPDPAIYAMDLPYPGEWLAGWSVAQRGEERVVNVRLAPVQYIPAYALVLATRQMDLVLTWEPPAGADATKGGRTAGRVGSLASPVLTHTGRVDYVVITSPDLLAGAGEYGFPALCAARSRGGLITTTVTTDWIYANYPGNRPDGGVDPQTRIRNFIRDAYENWGTRFVLLGGTAARVPVRGLYGSVLTGGGPQVDSIASDLYYGCLDGTFDFNANGVYGESGDGEGGQDVDLTAEVYVGRFPVNTPAEVAYMVRKTLAYEQATPEQLRKICHTGEWLGFGGVSDYATATMEQLRLGGSYDGYSTIGFANSVQADRFDTSDNLYDAPGYWWGNGEIIRRFQSDFHVFNHLGHGNWNYCFRLNTIVAGDRSALAALTNRSYFLAYSQACQAGRFDDRDDCLAEMLVTVSNGPAALILNTRDGWGLGYSTDGPSQRYHRNFWHELLGGKSYQLGVANQRSKENLRFAVNYYGGAMRWCYYELTLFGDPALPFGASISPLPPTITHLPLQNQLATSTAYRVACDFGPVGLYDPDSAELVWTSTQLPDQVTTTRFTQVEGASYEALLPTAPCGASFEYAIRLSTRAGLTVTAPIAGVYRFAVTPVFALQVEGAPQPLGTVSPPYGVSQVASGNWVVANAPLRVVGEGGTGWRCAGWTGEGSVPDGGASNSVSFPMNASSRLVWNWMNQYLLAQGSAPAGLIATNDWYDAGGLAGTMPAPAQAVAGGTNYQFVGWYLDGERVPLTGRAASRLSQVLMDRPRAAVARYLPAEQDADGDGVPDWWECYYYGDTTHSAAEDTDGDGADLRLEYLALTDPTDPGSRPTPPAITVTPLAPVQTSLPPYAVTVRIEGTSPLATAQLIWQRNAEAERSAPVTPVDGADQTYAGLLISEAASGDRFVYRVEAVGRDGLSAQSAVFTTYLHYAVMTLATPVSRAYVAGDDGVVTDRLGVANSGTAALSWEALAGLGESADVEPSDWRLAALGTAWTRSAARSFSAPASLYARITSAASPSGRSQHAAMTSPVMRLGTHAILAFRYWIHSELDTSRAGYCWDGGVVEISTDGGGSFTRLSGPYTHRISGWSASPWVDGTPCFAGAGEGWREVSFDLAAFAGADAILRFHYGADDNTDREGWYVDDIRVAPVLSGMTAGCALSPAAGTVAPGAGSNLTLVVDTAAFPRRPLRLPLLVRGNDPVTPVLWYELALDCRYLNQLTLLGTNGARVVSAAPASAVNGSDFGRVPVGSVTRTNRFRVANRSDAPLSVTGVATSGTGAACFRLTDLPAVLPAHATNEIAVAFSPRYGVQEAQLTLSHSGTNGPFMLCVAGVGVFTLEVEGAPQTLGTVSPPYGVSQVASGNWVEASAPLRVVGEGGIGWRCAGWTGEGSVPVAGASNGVSFPMNASSRLVWNWTNQYLLTQGSAPAGLFATTNDWYDAGGLAGTMTAPAQAVAGGTNYQFIGWYLDGERVPLTGRAASRLSQILMHQPREAVARYLPAEQDADGDGVPDWWECYYYGDTTHSAAEDADGDGAGLRLEYLALTDPTDPGSRPMPPVITVIPLAAVQTSPPPYAVTVRIEGTSPLATAQLVWRRNGGASQAGSLTPVDGAESSYAGVLSGAAAPGDHFAYWVEAGGRDGLSAQSAVFTTDLDYATMTLAAPVSRAYVAGDDGVVTDRLGVVNSGTAALSWEAQAGYGESADVEPPDWNLAPLEIPWTRSTARSLSAPAALHATIASPAVPLGRSQHAAMTSPVLRLGTNAVLAFGYWMDAELDTSRAGHSWDGGVVEISTNGGKSFAILSGPYTHRISGWFTSPWADGTPCFAGAGEGWREVSFDLAAFAGADAILRFHYGADDNTDREGWYVDDIRVAPVLSAMTAGCALSPAGGTVAPGTGSNLTLVVDTAAFPRRPLRLPLLVRGSDPVTPVLWYDLALDCRYLNQLTILGTNGVKVVSAAPASAGNGSDFGRVPLGTGSRTNWFQVANRSDAPLTVTGVATSGTGAACFRLSDLPATLPAHTTNDVAVRFAPQRGVQEAQLVIAHSGTNGPFVLRVAGAGGAVITNVLPDSGTIYGGTEVAISGLWLGNGTDITQVTLCGVPATILSQAVHAVWVLSGVAPLAATGEVCVVSAGADPVVLPGGFAYRAVPPPPVAGPAEAIATNRFTACWSTAISATRYVVDVATNSAFAALLAAYAGREVGDVTACLVTGLVDRTVYYYRVRAVNAHGCSTNSNTIAVPTGANVPYQLGASPAGVASPGASDRIVLTRLVHGTNLNYAVIANSQTGLVTAVVIGTNLDLRYAAGATGGTVRIAVRAANADGYYQDLEVVLALAPPPGLVLGPVAFNRQTGLYEQSAVVSNRSPTLAAQSVVLTVTGLPAGFRLYNGTGFNLAGQPEIRWTGVLPAGAAMRFLLQYYSASRGAAPAPTVAAALGLAPLAQQAAVGVGRAIGRIAPLAGSSLLIEFPAVPGLFYQVQYADGLTNVWRTVEPVIEAPANRVQWIDAGPPGTVCPPGAAPVRFYRVVEVTP